MFLAIKFETKSFPWSLLLLIVLLISFVFSIQGLSLRQIRFRFDGQPINETDTPSQVCVPCRSNSLMGWFN